VDEYARYDAPRARLVLLAAAHQLGLLAQQLNYTSVGWQ
jgi:hypothetical protein